MGSSWGAIFDFDGVIVDTEECHEECWQLVAQEEGLPITHEQYLLGFGVKNDRFISEILGWTGDPACIARISKRKELLFQQIAHKVRLIEGVQPLLESLHTRGVPCVIASSSILKNIEILLESLQVGHYFDKIVSGQDVRQGKPDPEAFLCAAKKLQLAPGRCVVFEDALFGVEASFRAGCKTIALTTTFPRERFVQLDTPVDKIIDAFSQISVEELDQWFA